MAQEIINTGTTANDGTGDPLRTAFIKTDSNFDQIWAAGPVGTNVQISGNTISTVQVNQDLVLAPNGVANVRINNNTVPNANNIWYLGSVTNQWRGLYVGNVVAGNISISDGLTVPGDVSIGGNLTVEGDVIQIGNIVTDSKTIQLANTASTDAAANGSGITVGANDDVATLLYNSTSNEWRTNIGANIAGNITGQYFIGDGSQLTGLPAGYANANAVAYGEAGWAGNIIPSGNGTYSLGNSTNYWSNLWVASNTIYIGGVALGVTGNTLTVAGEPVLSNDSTSTITTTGNITADYFLGNGSQLTGTVPLSNVSTYINVANVQGGSSSSYKIPFTALEQGGITQLEIDDIGPGLAYSPANGMVTCGNLRVTGNITAGDNSNISTLSCNVIIATGNITADYFIGDGSQLTGLSDGTAIVNGTSQIDIPTANGNIYVGVNNVGSTEFTALGINTLTLAALANITAAGTITATGNLAAGNISTGGAITATGNVSADRILTNSLLSDTDVFVQALDGLVDIRANGNVVIKSADANYEWVFDDAGVLTTPGDISIDGGLELSAGIVTTATNSSLQAANGGLLSLSSTDSNTTSESAVRVYVDTADNANNRVYIYTDNQGTGDLGTWTFAPDGTLSLPGDTAFMDASANFVGIYPDASQNNGIELYTTNTEIFNDGNVNISANVAGTGKTWTFDNTGELTAPGAISATGNITASANINAAGGTFTANITSTGNIATTRNVDVTGFIYTNVISGRNSGAISLAASNVDVTTGNVNFNTATAVKANVIIATGNITGANLVTAATVFADAVDANSATIDGNLVVDGNVTATADLTLRAGAGGTINFPVTGGNIEFDAATGNVVFPGNVFTGDVSTTGNITATGNVSSGNIIAATEVAVDALSITNSSIAAVTQFTISTSNTATGNSSSILMDRNGVGVVVQLQDTGGGPYSWGLYQDNILFPDGSRQYSAYGNANVVANLAALGSNPISTTGNITAANFIGNISITGNVTGTSANVDLVAGSYTYTFDNTGVASFPTVGGDEGGELNLGIPAANTTLQNSVKIDVYQDRLRFFEGSANVKGAYVDLANCPSGVSAAIGYRDIPQISLSANTTATGNAAGCHYYSTTAGSLQLTIPDNANVAFPTGATLTIVMNASGNVIVAQGTGVSLYMAGSSSTGNRTVGAYGLASVMKVATDTWVISGTGVY